MKLKELATKAVAVEEIDVQRVIVEYLQLRKYIVLTTNVSVRKAAAAAGREAVGAVCSPGVPDLLVSRPTWPKAMWLGLELKRPPGMRPDGKAVRGGKPTPAQAALLKDGRIVIVRSVEEARLALEAFEGGLNHA